MMHNQARVRHLLHTCLVALTIMSGTSAVAFTQPWYVSTTGSDSNTGTLTSPFRSIEKAVSVVKAGESIFVRGGSYNLTTTITLGKSGTASAGISLLAYPGEKPVLDFSGQIPGGSNRGIVLTGSWWHIKRLRHNRCRRQWHAGNRREQ